MVVGMLHFLICGKNDKLFSVLTILSVQFNDFRKQNVSQSCMSPLRQGHGHVLHTIPVLTDVPAEASTGHINFEKR
jgi:hypothetical protein